MKGDTTMRKFIVCALVALTAVSAFAAKETTLADSVRVRNQHHNVMVNLGAGLNTMVYKIDNGNTRLGGGMQLQGQYQYMFNENWGIGAGIGFSTLKSRAILNNMAIVGQSTGAGANQAYVPSFTVNDGWKEIQNMISIDIPVQAFYRYPINDKWALQAGLGLTLNFPAWMGYNVKNGTAVKTADFSESMGGNMVLDGDIKGHGLGECNVENLKGGIAHKAANIGMQADFGGLYNITELLDLYFGLYLDAQFLSCQKQTADAVLNPNENTYTSVMNTPLVKKNVNPLEFGVKVGVRIGMRDKKAEAQEVERILTDRLDAYKSAELSEVGREAGLEDGTASEEMQAIYAKYAEAIANASSQEEVDELIAQAKAEIALQKTKEATIADVQSTITEEDSEEVRAIAAAYAEAIRNASSAEEVEALKAAALKAMQDQRDKEEADRQEQLRRERAEEEARLAANLNAKTPTFNKIAKAEIDTLVAYLESHPDDILCITGHNDSTGNADKDMYLALERAQQYKEALVARGVPEDRIVCFSKGSEEPIATNKTSAGRAANRRVAFGVRSKAEVEAEQSLADARQLAWEVEQARLAAQSGLDKVIDTRNVTFALGSDVPEFNEAAIEGVKTVAAFMEQFPTKNLLLVGHTDNTGDADYNVVLGRKRAQGYKTKMAEYGIAADRVECDSKGPYQPIESNDTREGRKANRRVEMSFVETATAEANAVLVDVPAAAESEVYPMLTEARGEALNSMAAVIVRPDDQQIAIFNKYAAQVNNSNSTDAIAAIEKAYAQEMDNYLKSL